MCGGIDMKTPTKVSKAYLVADCSSVNITEWDSFMAGTTKANGRAIRGIIKEHIPSLYYSLGLDFPNPYENQCVKKDGLLVYVHSSIEYFIRYK